ncbi:MAG TPA: DUF2490 domain-containing protein [Cyclobacteriaceae bacterium]|nr:DUF2490 domain-containing protein [Cyclobacteriaceae bacterium]
MKHLPYRNLNALRIHAGSIVLILLASTSFAQTNSQFWLEGMSNNPFANVYNLETAFTYATTLSEKPKWNSYDLQFTLERAFGQRFDLQGALLISSTLQNDSLSTREIRPMIGGRIHFTPNSRILTRLLIRFENRNMLNTETDTWSSSNRSRLRLESLVPFNKPSMFAGDNLWYGVFDAEVFAVMDKNLHERYANRYRLRAGVGYRVSYSWRFELMYTLQESRNTIGSEFTTEDNIFRVRIKHFMNKSKPSTVTGNGN